MCGIFGTIGNSISEKQFTLALNSLGKRGPDESKVYKDKRICLGFNRLKIIDLSSNASQPMSNNRKNVLVVFNGEIYNFLELRKSLSNKHRFNSFSDTEVLLHGYEEWGIDGLLKKIDGMFAFALYDSIKNICFLVRDRIGEKPLYYYKTDNNIFFSSETKAFFHLKDFSFQINPMMFNLFMGFSYLPDNRQTILSNVFKLAPGSYLKINIENQNSKEIIYWKLKETYYKSSFKEEVTKTKELLIDSVNKQLRSDVPLGILLSGGLDSSLITAIASSLSKNKITTINISFNNSKINESSFAKKVADYCKTKHVQLELNETHLYKKLKENIGLFDDISTVDGGILSTYLLSKEINNLGIKVILTGEGADEVFGGYSWFGLSQFPFSIIPSSLKSKLYYYSIMRIFNNKKFKYHSKYLNDLLAINEGDYFKKIQKFEIKYSLPNHYCMKLDKGSMGASVEARCPYLDYRLINRAYNMKPEYLLNSKIFSMSKPNEKYILREIAKQYLPKEIVLRKKKGGMLPAGEILKQGIKQDSKLIIENIYLNNFFGNNYLSKLIKSSPKTIIGKWQKEWILWKCLIFSLWYQYYQDYGKN